MLAEGKFKMNIMTNIQLENNLSEDPLLTLASFEFDHKFYQEVHAEIVRQIDAYDPDGFSPHLIAHQERVAGYSYGFLTEDTPTRKAYSEGTAYNISKVFGWHDTDKLLDDPKVWRVQDEKPDLSKLTPDELAERKRARNAHALRGGVILQRAVATVLSNRGQAELTPNQARMIELATYIISYHHESLDGSGPHGLPAAQQGPVIQTLKIIDTLDGKTKTKKDLAVMFDDMAVGKHNGQFDSVKVREYQAYYARLHGSSLSAGLANPHVS